METGVAGAFGLDKMVGQGAADGFMRQQVSAQVVLAGLAIWVGQLPALAASKTLTFSDGTCQYRVAYDPAKVDGARLKATFDYLHKSDNPIEIGPPLNEPSDLAAIDLKQYRADCAAHRKRLEAPKLADVPGVEALRQEDIARLDDACAMTAGKLAAAKGDVAALASYAPAAPACGRWAEALATPAASLKARFDDLLVDLCKSSTAPNICMDHLQKESEKPQRDARMRLAILVQGWAECAAPHMLINKGVPAGAAETAGDRDRGRLRELLAKRFKARALSCSQ